MAKLRRKMVMWLRRVIESAHERACRRELEKTAERLVKRKCTFVRMIGNEPKNFVFADADFDAGLSVCGGRYRIYGYAVVENPEFWASPWWRDSPFVRFEGKYVVLEMTYAGAVWVYALLRIVQ